MSIYNKLATAKQQIAGSNMEKKGRNDYSKYKYFTPEQVEKLVADACNENKLLTMFSLKRDENGVYGVLTIVDLENGETVDFIAATAIPEIKATNIAQQLGGCMTYCERYLKQTAFGIYDNNLDFDTTENTKKVAKAEEKPADKKAELPRFNNPELEKLKGATEYLKKFEKSIDLINDLLTKFRISDTKKREIADVWASVK